MADEQRMKTQSIEIDDHRIEYSLSGEGDKPIILINGFRMPLDSWSRLYPKISQISKVFAYNRLGVGNSSKATFHQTGPIIVETLRGLLLAVNLRPPYVLVGHSLGGLYANLYSCMYPEEVSSMIFVDATHPDEPSIQLQFQRHSTIAEINNWIKSIERHFYKYKYSEEENISVTVEKIKGTKLFPQFPVAVVSGSKKMPFIPLRNFQIHLQFQQSLAEVFTGSKFFNAKNSGHFPQVTEPNFVLQAIEETFERSSMPGGVRHA